MKIAALIFLISSILILNCQTGSEGEDPPPGKVKLVAKTAEDDTLEHGIDAIPEQNAIYLEWYQLPEEDIQRYEIFRMANDSTGRFPRIGIVEKRFGVLDTFFIDNNVDLQTRYYYYVRAVDEQGQEGPISEKATYMLLHKPRLVVPEGDNYTGIFIWDFDGSEPPPHNYVFRLMKFTAGNYTNFFTKLQSLGTDYIHHQERTLSDFGLNSSLPTGTYRWRIDVIGSEDNQGAESAWLIFTVN